MPERTIEDRLDHIEHFPVLVKEAIVHARGEADLVDILGTVRAAERGMQNERRRADAEIPPGTNGNRFVMEQGRAAKRSYNTPSLLGLFLKELMHDSLVTTLSYLLAKGIITIKWNWTPLQKETRDRGIGLRVARHEITDGDLDWDIGEVWGDGYPSYRRLKEESE